ncbi:hypothetical protein SKAU_G00307840 [Synaphobranchus kaupii]|uniref:DNA/RNA-binding protein Alba-like domain-containing protein n=1 Tax=Synaphobranchus kaupii TaxID=118154 RepID=A0A9Q1ER62_SYNKA|nr:hypothetical protein SKAU_G00307840 [Synaphobranchus kaupii]
MGMDDDVFPRCYSPVYRESHADTPPTSVCEAAAVPLSRVARVCVLHTFSGTQWRQDAGSQATLVCLRVPGGPIPCQHSLRQRRLETDRKRASTVTATQISAYDFRAPPSPHKPGRGGFRKVCRTEEAGPCPFPGLAGGSASDAGRGRAGGAAERRRGRSSSRAPGRAVTKTITCAEIMKRKVQGLHQVTKLHYYKGVQEVWERQEGGASEMTVHRTVPSISILLSKDPLDPQEPGLPAPCSRQRSLEDQEGRELPLTASKRPSCPPAPPSQPDSKRVCLMDRPHQH